MPECPDFLYAHGWCVKHYKRWKKTGDPNGTLRVKRQGVEPCVIAGCEGTYFNRGWCKKHYARWYKHGDPLYRVRGEVRDGCRQCQDCKRDLPVEEFATYKTRCRPCGAAHAAAKRAPYEPKRYLPAICDMCGTPFMGNAKQTRYCSRDCASANKNRANWPHLNARRARLREAFVEKFDRIEIFERDGWVCGICGGDVDPDTAWPDPSSASLDHIVPVSRGGKHERANAQCSHLACNVKKGASAA